MLALKPRSEAGKEEVIRTCKSSHVVDADSSLRPILDMMDPDQQVWIPGPTLTPRPHPQAPPVPPSLLAAGMRLLSNLWEARHISVLDALRTSDKNFWKNLLKPLLQSINIGGAESDEEQEARGLFLVTPVVM